MEEAADSVSTSVKDNMCIKKHYLLFCNVITNLFIYLILKKIHICKSQYVHKKALLLKKVIITNLLNI